MIFTSLYTASTAGLLNIIIFIKLVILPNEGNILNAATTNTDSVGIKYDKLTPLNIFHITTDIIPPIHTVSISGLGAIDNN